MLHVLTSGYAKVVQTTPHGARVLLRYIGPGEPFGMSSLIANRTYSADVITVSDAAELQWPARAVREMLSKHPVFAVNAIQVFDERLRAAERTLGELSNEPVEQRIAQALLRLSGKLGRPMGTSIEVPFALTRQDIADMTGSTLHTVSRVFQSWQGQGLMCAGRQRIAVSDVQRLRAVADAARSGETSPRRTHRRGQTCS